MTAITHAKGATTFAGFTYTRDPAGKLASVASTGVPADNHAFGYTSLDQLKSVDSGQYAYDAADNLTGLLDGRKQAFDDAHQLCFTSTAPGGSCTTPPAGATTFGYDQDGNRTSSTQSGGATTTLGYDQADRLVSAPGTAATTLLAAGASHSLAVTSGGAVLAWGKNKNGQLGDNTTTGRKAPVAVSGLSGVRAVSGGSAHSLAVLSGGTVRAWGANGSGRLGDGSTTQRLTPVAVSGLSGVAMVAAGAEHSLALKSDGTVWAWGLNSSGQLGDGTQTARKTAVQVPGLTGVTMIAAGDYHSLAVKSDGTVWAWGKNQNGQLGDGTTTNRKVPTRVLGLSGVIGVAAGSAHSLAVLTDGTVRAWGANGSGRLGDGTTTQRLSPVTVSALTGVASVVAGATDSFAVRSDGSVRAWGDNASGKLGDGTTTARTTPVTITGLTGVSGLAGGGGHTLALKRSGAGYGFGLNADGQLGDGTTTSHATPTPVSGLGGAQDTTYVYDADGLRAGKTTAAATTAFAWDQSTGLPLLLSEKTAGQRTTYVYGPDDRVLERIDPAGSAVWYHADQLGSVRALTNQTGVVAATITYDSYGKPTTTGAITQPFGYAGQYTDPETGYQYLRARYYDPTTGQFLTRDPLETQTQTPYAYTNNNPTNLDDPSGLVSLRDIRDFGAGALDTLTGGISNKLLGFNPDCAGPGYGFGQLAGLAGVLINPEELAGIGAKAGGFARRAVVRLGDETGAVGRFGNLGNLASRANETAADVIRSRGGGASQVNQLQTGYGELTLGELSHLAAHGDHEAARAIKMAKQAGSQGKGGR